jgi:cytochrome P450
MTPKVRFAPSPTGRIHIGNARTALMNWLFAKHRGGTFVLRFDDTDLERSKEEYALDIEVDLAWLGVKPDPYTWMPFGGGIRRCIGMAFAMFEMRIVLAAVVPRVRMHLAGPPARVVRRGITLAPAGGTRVIVDERLRHAG